LTVGGGLGGGTADHTMGLRGLVKGDKTPITLSPIPSLAHDFLLSQQ